MKKLFAASVIIFCHSVLHAQTELPVGLTAEGYSNEYLDTLNVKKKLVINDYTMFGVQYGVGLSQVMWNPSQKQEMVFIPYNVGVTFTTYQKMFGFMPYFGFQAGVFYTREGYQFKLNENTDYIYKVEGAV